MFIVEVASFTTMCTITDSVLSKQAVTSSLFNSQSHYIVCKSSPPEAMCTSVCCLVRVAHISVADREVSASDSLRTALDHDSCRLK